MNNNLEKFSNKEIVYLLRSIAAVYILKGENRFRIIAYEKAADTIEHLTRELKDIWHEGKIYEVAGIGSTIGSNLEEYLKLGYSKHFESILKKIPKSVFVLMKIPTIGPKKAFKLVNTLGLNKEKTVIDDLKTACMTGKVEHITTFGLKSQSDILNAINLYEHNLRKIQRMTLPYAFSLASKIVEYLNKNKNIQKTDILGSLRRMVTTIGDIDIAVQIKNSKINIKNVEKEIVDYFVKYPGRISIDNAGERKASIVVRPNIKVDLRIEPESSYGSMLQYFTGSKSHNINFRAYALKKGYSVSEYGIKVVQNKSKIRKFSKEKDFYNFLGLQYVPPEIREGTNEIELAKENKIPKLISLEDIKGDLHLHSSYDLKPSHDLGRNTYLEILDKADDLNYEYVGFSDHNPKNSDLTSKQVIEIMKKRRAYIEAGCKKYQKVKYFIGLEVDIQPDGVIALPEEAIEYVDYLIVAIHSVFNLDSETMTQRVLKALNYPKVKVLGHPTGRLLNKREGYELDWKKIFECCSKKNIALEINAWPERLDLPDTLVKEGLNYGVKYVINTDAHVNELMESMFYGVSVAKRGWCKKSDIINSLSYNYFANWIFGRR